MLSPSMLLETARTHPVLSVLCAGAFGSVYALTSWIFGGVYHHPWQLPAVVFRVAATVQLTLLQYIARGFKPLFPEWTLRFELTRAVINCLLRNYGDRVTTPENAAFLRRQSELLGPLAGYAANQQNNTVTTTFIYNGLEHVWVRSASSSTVNETPQNRMVVLYFHGGGYVLLSPHMYIGFASELKARIHPLLVQKLDSSDQNVQVDVLLANYRKAPQHPYPIPPQDALKMYEYLLNVEKLSPSRIIVMGDSAGAGLTMTTILRLRDKDPSLLPAAAILSCPLVDMETDGDETKTPYCLLTDRVTKAFGIAYRERHGPPSSWGDASPLHCDLAGLPPAYIQAAELDYLLAHATKLHAKAMKTGLAWKLEIFPNLPHVFSITPPAALPMAGKALDTFAEYAASQFAASSTKKAAETQNRSLGA